MDKSKLGPVTIDQIEIGRRQRIRLTYFQSIGWKVPVTRHVEPPLEVPVGHKQASTFIPLLINQV
jgi:hypothetical protein